MSNARHHTIKYRSPIDLEIAGREKFEEDAENAYKANIHRCTVHRKLQSSEYISSSAEKFFPSFTTIKLNYRRG